MEADADYAVVCPAIQLSDLIAAAGKASYLYYFAHLQGSDGEFDIPPPRTITIITTLCEHAWATAQNNTTTAAANDVTNPHQPSTNPHQPSPTLTNPHQPSTTHTKCQ